jgi:hypothetical protein
MPDKLILAFLNPALNFYLRTKKIIEKGKKISNILLSKKKMNNLFNFDIHLHVF